MSGLGLLAKSKVSLRSPSCIWCYFLGQIARLSCCTRIWWTPLVHLNFLVRPSVPAPEPLSHSSQQKSDKATRLRQFKGLQGPRIQNRETFCFLSTFIEFWKQHSSSSWWQEPTFVDNKIRFVIFSTALAWYDSHSLVFGFAPVLGFGLHRNLSRSWSQKAGN